MVRQTCNSTTKQQYDPNDPRHPHHPNYVLVEYESEASTTHHRRATSQDLRDRLNEQHKRERRARGKRHADAGASHAEGADTSTVPSAILPVAALTPQQAAAYAAFCQTLAAQQMRDTLEARKRGDLAFRDRDFKTAIDCYSQFTDVGTMVSPTVYARRSLCYLLSDQPDAALRDAMQAQCVYPDWSTAFYMQAVALAKLDMQKDAVDMLSEAATLEEKKQQRR